MKSSPSRARAANGDRATQVEVKSEAREMRRALRSTQPVAAVDRVKVEQVKSEANDMRRALRSTLRDGAFNVTAADRAHRGGKRVKVEDK